MNDETHPCNFLSFECPLSCCTNTKNVLSLDYVDNTVLFGYVNEKMWCDCCNSGSESLLVRFSLWVCTMLRSPSTNALHSPVIFCELKVNKRLVECLFLGFWHASQYHPKLKLRDEQSREAASWNHRFQVKQNKSFKRAIIMHEYSSLKW